MANTWSGAVIYEWIQEMNNYGLVSYGPQQAANVQVGSSVIQGFVIVKNSSGLNVTM